MPIFAATFILLLLFTKNQNVFAINWKQMETPHFIIFYDDLNLAVKTKKLAESNYDRLVSELSFKPKDKIKIYLYSNQKEYLAINPPEETIGFAEPSSNQISLSAEAGSLETTIPHEITHIIFIKSIPEIFKIPFWFIEGLAIFESDYPSYSVEEENLFLKGDIDSIPRLNQIMSAPSDVETRRKVSLEGYLIIKFISSRYGTDKLRIIITNLQHRSSFENAIKKSLGININEFDILWREHINKKRNGFLLLSSLRYFGWMILSVTVIISTGIWLIRWRRRFDSYQEDEDEKFEEETKDKGSLL
ncbi:MAG: hypothetical protein HY776_00330 [Actinobacteria bacterium]|nr:hypothetical protein [Actinomycetota bacterium]